MCNRQYSIPMWIVCHNKQTILSKINHSTSAEYISTHQVCINVAMSLKYFTIAMLSMCMQTQYLPKYTQYQCNQIVYKFRVKLKFSKVKFKVK